MVSNRKSIALRCMLVPLCLSLSILWAFFVLLWISYPPLWWFSVSPSWVSSWSYVVVSPSLVGRPPSNSPRGGNRLFRESWASPIWLCLQMPLEVAAVKIWYGVVQNLNSPTPNVLDLKAGALTLGWVLLLGCFGGGLSLLFL